jgi:hypothetical protein
MGMFGQRRGRAGVAEFLGAGQLRVLNGGARITGGVVCLACALTCGGLATSANAASAAVQRRVVVVPGHVLVTRGGAPKDSVPCLQAPTKPTGTWHNLTCTHTSRSKRFTIRWRVPRAYKGGQARIAYHRHGLHIIWRRLLVVSPKKTSAPSPTGPSQPPSSPSPPPTSPDPPPTSPTSPSLPQELQDYALHVVFWTPPGTTLDPSVEPGMDQLENDIQTALASGQDNNIFAIPGLYPSGDPRIASIDTQDDSDSIPHQPSDSDCAGNSQPCAEPADIGQEVNALALRGGWAGGQQSLTLIVFGSPALACNGPNECSPAAEPCGYHGYTGTHAYSLIIMSGADADCGGNGSFGGPDLDYAEQLTGHEQNEAVADPSGEGTEIADPCQGQFANNDINGHQYFLPYLLLPSGQCASAPPSGG